MKPSDAEVVPLVGGRLTKGVVRIGDTVRRPRSPSSDFVEQLLRECERVGFAGVPRYLGRDEQGRDVLTYLAGWVPPRWVQFSDDQVLAAGRLLRSFHDATRGSKIAGSSAVVCHNDFGPSNAIFEEQRPVAMIDFDMAAPGEPVEDLGYSAWAWCVSSKPERQPVSAQAQQVSVLVRAYGLEAPAQKFVVQAMLQRQQQNAHFWSGVLERGDDVATPTAKIVEIIEWSRRELAYTLANRRTFEAALYSR